MLEAEGLSMQGLTLKASRRLWQPRERRSNLVDRVTEQGVAN